MRTLLIALLLLSTPSHAAGDLCGPRDKIAAALLKGYQEHPTIVARVTKKLVVEVFTSEKGTWTLLWTWSDGRSCLAGAGDSIESIPQGERI